MATGPLKTYLREHNYFYSNPADQQKTGHYYCLCGWEGPDRKSYWEHLDAECLKVAAHAEAAKPLDALQHSLHSILDDLAKDQGRPISTYWYQEVNVALTAHAESAPVEKMSTGELLNHPDCEVCQELTRRGAALPEAGKPLDALIGVSGMHVRFETGDPHAAAIVFEALHKAGFVVDEPAHAESAPDQWTNWVSDNVDPGWAKKSGVASGHSEPAPTEDWLELREREIREENARLKWVTKDSPVYVLLTVIDRLRSNEPAPGLREAAEYAAQALERVQEWVRTSEYGKYFTVSYQGNLQRLRAALTAPVPKESEPHLYGQRYRWSSDHSELWNRMHELWTWAVGKPEYNKEAWNDFSNLLTEKQDDNKCWRCGKEHHPDTNCQREVPPEYLAVRSYLDSRMVRDEFWTKTKEALDKLAGVKKSV